MEAVEFMKQKDRMCDYYSDRQCMHDESGETCPAMSIDCEITTDKLEQLVAIVEQWAKEHPEKPEQERQKPEQERQKPEQDDIEGAIYREIISHKTRIENLKHDISVIWHNLDELADQIHALREKVDHATTTEQSQTPKPKRANKDVLLAAFPNARMDSNGVPRVCPRELYEHYHCSNWMWGCSVCKCAYWLAEVEK